MPVTWLLCDYGEVLALPPAAAERGVKLALLSNAPARLARQLDRLPWLAPFCPRIFTGPSQLTGSAAHGTVPEDLDQ
jgi:hypothetical protein